MRRVLVLVPFPMTQEQLDLRRAQADAAELPPDVELDYRPVLAAPSSYVSHHDYVLADISLFEAGLEAQAEGYDAVCIDTMSDDMNCGECFIPCLPGETCMDGVCG